MSQAPGHARLNGNRWTWAWAVAGTLALNLALFGVIPGLMKPRETLPAVGTMIPQIRLARLHGPESEPSGKKNIPPVKPRQEKFPARPRMNRPVNPPPPLALPFKVNPRLPGSPRDLVLPGVMSKSLDIPDLAPFFDPGDLDQPLTALSRIRPVYPPRAKSRGIEGWVAVEFMVTEQGLVTDIRILAAEPEEIFDKSVIQCVSAWRFKPGKVDRKPVKTRVKTRIRFELN